MRRLLFACLLLGCHASERERVMRVEQASTDDGIADSVFGQPNLTTGTEPAFVGSNTTSFPASVGANATPSATEVSPMFFVADERAHRVLGVYTTATIGSLLAGQSSYGGSLPNMGGGVGQTTLSSPRAVAFFAEQLAIADTGNHRVVFGPRNLGSFPWYPQYVYGHANRFDLGDRNNGGPIGPDTLAEPSGVAFDATFTPGRLLIADTGNNRVLIFLISVPISTTPKCVGQEDCYRGDPNRGGSVSALTLNQPTGIATYNKVDDPLRGFYVADTGNHRVLHFASTATTPDAVYGQFGDFTTAVPSKGGVSASSLRSPTGVAVDLDGSLYIADTGHHRVLHFPKGKTVADRVLGQPDFTSSSAPTSASATRMRAPAGIAVLFREILVADTGFSRVLRFRRPCDAAACDDGNPCTDDTCDGVGVCRNTLRSYSMACSPYLCDNATRTCTRPCDDKRPCLTPYACIEGVCVIRCFNDAGCMSVGRKCVDGYCCDRECNGPCETCNRAKNQGTCVIAAEGPPPAGRFCAESTGECGYRCNGFEGSKCDIARAGSPCGAESCDGNRVNKRGRCDGAGSCSDVSEDCAPYACEVNACRTSCRFDFDCAPGAHCNAAACVDGVGGGAAGGGCTYDPRANALAAIVLGAAVASSMIRRRR